jgi:adenosylhomocysteinase
MDGFSVMTMEEAAPLGDLFITVTGCEDVVTEPHFLKMKDGAICCNAGHFECEVAVAKLRKMAVRCRPARAGIEAFELPSGKTVYILAEGRLVNLAAGDGHPAEIMDMSFAIQALSARYLVEHRSDLVGRLHNAPAEIDQDVARRKLASWGVTIDTLTPEQHLYIYGE